LSANDRSRWCTVAALVEDGTFAIDRQMSIKDPSGRRRPWATIDRVRHTGPDGVMHDYSSKPPLLSVMIAGIYWLVKQASNMTLTEQPIYVARIVLALVNLPMLLVMLVSVWRSVQGCLAPDSAKFVGLSVACFATALLPMSTTLNNHLPAAMSTAVVLGSYLHVAGKSRLKSIASTYFIAGLAAAFTVVNELPALAMLPVWAFLFMRQHVQATIAIFLPAVLLVVIAFFAMNQLAHQSFRPPYMHRSDGAVMGTLELPATDEQPSLERVTQWFRDRRDVSINHAPFELVKTASPDRWIAQTIDGNRRYAIVMSPSHNSVSEAVETVQAWTVHQWDHWYDYPGSYWMTERKGVDRGEPSRIVYLFHTTFGYYGLFSLTPIWLFLPLGLFLRIAYPDARYRHYLAIGIAIVTLVCFCFYMSRPLIDRNYGGVSSSFRWMLWFTPLWIWAMLPAITYAILGKWEKWVVMLFLLASIFSAATALGNPWQHPWIYRFLDFLGWLNG
jgi:hypothetical protein